MATTSNQVRTLDHLTPKESANILAVAVRATTADGEKPLSEQTVLDLSRLASAEATVTHTTHLVVHDRPGEINAHVLGYAHIEHDPSAQFPTFELVVHPDHRRRGVGTALLDAVMETWPTARGWAHGNLKSAQALTQARGMSVSRALWRMGMGLTGPDSLPPAIIPDGFAMRTFTVGADEEPWLEVNARAFANHGEQGRMTKEDLADRVKQSWFDPHGFLLIEDVSDADRPRLAAFHWTKVEPAEPGSSRTAAGEVYVVGVDPAYQGRGLGGVATLVGLRHLAACGLHEATLYVDGDNAAAIATYRRLGFTRTALDVMYSA